MAIKNKKLLTLSIKFIFVGIVLYFLTQKGFLSVDETKKAFQHPEKILGGFLLLFIASMLSIYRWKKLLDSYSLGLKTKKIFKLGLIGNFFNIALPGAVSGDIVKALYVANAIKGSRAQSFSSILFDRIVGLSALMLVSFGAMVFSYGSQWGSKVLTTLQFFMWLSGFGIFMFYAYLFSVKKNKDPLFKLLNHLKNRYPFINGISKIYEGIRDYHSHKITVIFVLLLSVFIHLLAVSACVLFSYTLETTLPTLGLFIVIPIGLLVSALPIFPAGIGTGHAAFLALFAIFKSTQGANVFTLYVLYKILEGVCGGVIYLFYRSHHTNLNQEQILSESSQ